VTAPSQPAAVPAPHPTSSALFAEEPPSAEPDPAPQVEPKLEFRLIDDTPRAATGLAPNAATARATTPSPPPR
jgi:hypothetical protein